MLATLPSGAEIIISINNFCPPPKSLYVRARVLLSDVEYSTGKVWYNIICLGEVMWISTSNTEIYPFNEITAVMFDL